MANLRDLRLRMRAIQQTLQVTKAMDLISTAKLRKGRRLLLDMEPYFTRIQKLMYDLLSGARMEKSIFFEGSRFDSSKIRTQQLPGRTAIVAISSDKGLAGGYNTNIYRHVNELCSQVKNPVLIIVGASAYKHFVHSQWLVLENYIFHSRLPDLDDAKTIADYLLSQYLSGMFDEVHIVYTHMYSTVKILPRDLQVLPLNENKIQEEFQEIGEERREIDFEYWPSTKVVFDSLVPMYVKGIIYSCLIEAYASEQKERMTAMDEASKNAEEMLTKLHILYNRTRQAGITQEMTEIVGGSEALKN